MKALKDCKWNVTVETYYDDRQMFSWKAETKSNIGITDEDDVTPIRVLWGKNYVHRVDSINNWKKFAKLNGITNYKIVE